MIDLPPAEGPAEPTTGPEPAGAPPVADASDASRIASMPTGFDRTRVAWMTAATGDTNPLHLDIHHARQRGFPDVVVPAPLITAWVEDALAGHLSCALAMLELRFQGPTLPDQSLSLHHLEPAGSGRIELRYGHQIRARGKFSAR